MRVAALQLDYPAGESRDDRIERVAALVADRPDADLVVLPELWDVTYFAFDDYAAVAGPLDDDRLRSLDPNGAVVVAGSILERDGDRLYNTSVVLDGDGRQVGSYRKRRLFGYDSRESQLLTSGNVAVVVDFRGRTTWVEHVLRSALRGPLL